MPVVFLLRKSIPDLRVAMWVWVMPFWVAVMFVYGVVIETRIYGEMCGLVTLATALLLDAYLAQVPRADVADSARAAQSTAA